MTTDPIKAAQTTLYGPKTREAFLNFFASDLPIADKLGHGIADLLEIMGAGGDLIGTGQALQAELAGVFQQAGMEVTNDDLAAAREILRMRLDEVSHG